jgi:hypothetical protein
MFHFSKQNNNNNNNNNNNTLTALCTSDDSFWTVFSSILCTSNTYPKTHFEMKNGVFWDVTPCGCCKNQVFLHSMRRLLVPASVVPSSPILVTLMVALSSSETSIITKATRRNIPENDILHSHHCETLKSYTALTDWAL